MKFVLTNDDGIMAPGIAALENACGEWETVTVAPDRPQSGVGHRVRTTAPIQIVSLDTDRFAVGGYPVDCTRVALRHLVPDADWILAGVNQGGNLGADFYPSGTVAAAREAALFGLPAIALSQYVERGREIDWTATTRRVRKVLHRLLEEPLEPGSYWNVNLPHPVDDSLDCDIVFCPLDPSPMDVRYRESDEGLIYEGNYFDRPRKSGHDVDVCFSGSIAISLLSVHDAGRSAAAVVDES